MEVVIYWSGALSLVAAILAALFGALGHRDLCIWTSFAAVVLAVFSGFCWLQNYHWNKDALTAHPANTTIGDRPYMFFQGADCDLASMKNPASPHIITFHFQNGGKSPAFGFGGQSYVSISDARLAEVPVGPLLPTETSRQFVAPGSVINQVVVCKNVFGDNATETVNKIENGEVFLYVYGHLDYEDRTTGTRRSLKFCGLYNPAIKQFETMPFGNEVE